MITSSAPTASCGAAAAMPRRAASEFSPPPAVTSDTAATCGKRCSSIARKTMFWCTPLDHSTCSRAAAYAAVVRPTRSGVMGPSQQRRPAAGAPRPLAALASELPAGADRAADIVLRRDADLGADEEVAGRPAFVVEAERIGAAERADASCHPLLAGGE